MAEAKAKVRKSSTVTKNRHRNAIQHFRKWLEDNPKARRKQRVEMFDFLVDHAESDD